MDDEQMGSTWVRGVEVDYSGDRINQLYGLTDPFDYVGMTKKLTKEESGTIYCAFVGIADETLRQKPPTTFPEKNFDERYFPFIDLLNAKIRPTSNTRTASVPRMYPLYRALIGAGKMNVGAAISSNLFKRTKERLAPLCYPGLIHQLCLAAGVDLTPFSGPNSELLTLGKPIPLPATDHAPDLNLFTPLACFEKDVGTHPADSVGPASRSSSSSSSRPKTSKKGPPTKKAKTMPPIPETAPEVETSAAATETAPLQGNQSVRPAPGATSSRPPRPAASTHQTSQSASAEPALPTPIPSPSPMSLADSGGATTAATMEMVMALFERRDHAEATRRAEREAEEERRRAERRKEKEEDRKREEEEKEKKREEKRQAREEERRIREDENRRRDEENRRRDEEYRRREEQNRKRDEMLMKQFQDNQLMMQSLFGLMQQGTLPAPPSTVTLALPAGQAGSSQTTSGTPAASGQPSEPSNQSDPAADQSQGQS